MYQGAVVEHRFAFKNLSANAIRVLGVDPVWPGGSGVAVPAVVPPRASGEVRVRQPVGGRLGLVGFRFILRTDDGLPDRKLMLTGFIQSAYDPDLPAVDFGTVGPGAKASLELFSREVERLDIREVQQLPEFLSADLGRRAGVAQEGVVLELSLHKDVPLGFRSGNLILRTNVESQPELTLAWRASVYEDVVPGENPLDLGIVREGQPFAKLVRLERRSGAPLELERVDGVPEQMKVESEPCPGAAAGCVSLRVSGSAPPAGSALGGSLTVVVKGGERPLSLSYAGIVVGARTTVKELGTVAPAAEAARQPPEGAPVSRPEPDAPPVLGRPGERQARLTWEAQQEDQAYGYLVYRSEERAGPFQRINPEIVRVSASPAPHTYAYVDTAVERGHTYYYYLETVDQGGRKARFSGVVAKIVPPAPR